MNNSKPKITPALPRGMRDLLPDQLAVRYKVIETLRKVFELYGFQPLETPAMERLEILSGKGGEESDKLSFLVMKRGAEFQRALDKVVAASQAGELNYGEAQKELADMGLRYDLTVPLARVVAMNQGKLPMPFKRYQIAPVWRAERPQHGRYREFTQCDVDIVGTDSPVADAEIISLFHHGFTEINNSIGNISKSKYRIDFEIRVNHRQFIAILSGWMGNRSDQVSLFSTSLDKLDKVGKVGVVEEMISKNLNVSRIEDLWEIVDHVQNTKESIAQTLEWFLGLGKKFQSEFPIEIPDSLVKSFVNRNMENKGLLGIFRGLSRFEFPPTLKFDPTLSRGLDYYTGMVFEVVAIAEKIGSLGGGGRYDELIGAFGKSSLPSVGASFGIDRIVDLFTDQIEIDDISKPISIGLLSSGEANWLHSRLFHFLRENQIPFRTFYDSNQRLEKQIQSAVKLGVGYVIFLNESDEIKYKEISDDPSQMLKLSDIIIDIKRLSDGEQRRLTLPQIVEWIKETAK